MLGEAAQALNFQIDCEHQVQTDIFYNIYYFITYTQSVLIPKIDNFKYNTFDF